MQERQDLAYHSIYCPERLEHHFCAWSLAVDCRIHHGGQPITNFPA